MSALPAQAKEDAYLWASGSSMTIGAAGSPGKAAALLASSHNAKNPTITIDTTDVAGVATAGTPDGCTAAGTKITCPLSEGEHVDDWVLVPLHPAAGVKPGSAGALRWTTKADNVAAYSDSLDVAVADGVDLVVMDKEKQITGVRPGTTVSVPMAAVNVGSRSTPAVTLTVFGEERFDLARYDGCQYGEPSKVAVCELAFDPPLAPGEGFEIEGGFDVLLHADASNEDVGYLVQPADAPLSLPKSMKLQRGSGGKLKVKRRLAAGVRAAADIDEHDNSGAVLIFPNTSADVAVQGTSIHGAAGAEVEAVIGVRNLGPATIESRSGSGAVWFEFTVPPGTEAVQVGNQCYNPKDDYSMWDPGMPGKPRYTCLTDNVFKSQATWTITFKLKINQAAPNAKGSVKIVNTALNPGLKDPNAANNAADVVVNPAAGNGGTLPITGVKIGVFVGIGAAVIALGVVLFVLARRRRVVLVSGEDGGE